MIFVSGAQLRAGAMEGAAESGTGWVSFSDQDTKITLLMFMKYNLPDTCFRNYYCGIFLQNGYAGVAVFITGPSV